VLVRARALITLRYVCTYHSNLFTFISKGSRRNSRNRN